jgi:predicted DCC family thiol-disulfide oxidoreductase YuxK
MMTSDLHQRLATYPAYSWRRDPAVPPFPDDKPIAIFDAVCVLCSRSMRTIARFDNGRHRFIAAQSPTGRALFRHFGLDPDDFETVLLLEGGKAYAKMTAVTGIARGMGGAFRAMNGLRLLPVGAQNWVYDRIAKSRYRIFGRSATCLVPDPLWRDRVIDSTSNEVQP